ncbi:MAG: hypothetical protein IJ131_06015 [Eggerthellaceae bacterium]|nr:hypothetical protein [Eggerthellaceae bacterium]
MDNSSAFAKIRPWAGYLASAAALLAILFAVSRLAPNMPTWGIALAWALLSLVPALGVSYHLVIKKTFEQGKYQEGGYGSRLVAGRVACLVVSFAVSAVFMASLLVECPKWDAPVWVLLVLAVPAYILVSFVVGKMVRKEYAPLHRQSYLAKFSVPVLGVLLCLAYAVVLAATPAETYNYAADAFIAEARPFADSPSTIMSEAGEALAVVDGLRSYALSKTAEGSFGSYVFWSLLLKSAAFFGFATLLSVCAIPLSELRRVFTELWDSGERGKDKPLVGRYVVLATALPVALAVGFVVADGNAAAVVESKGYSIAQEFARNSVDLVVYAIDGKRYDPEKVDGLLSRTRAATDEITEEEKEALTNLVNEVFDKRVENVDGYLDWYYRLFGDWEMLFKMIQGSAEEFAEEQFIEQIGKGVDDTVIAAEYEKYQARIYDLRASAMEELSEYEISDKYPDWLVTEVDAGESFQQRLDHSLEPAQQLLSAGERLGISTVAGVAAGVIAKKLIAKVAQKAFFKTIASRVGDLATTSAAAATLGGPPGAAIGIGVGLATDIALTKADELMNRESYKEEIVASINEQRDELLSAIGAIG